MACMLFCGVQREGDGGVGEGRRVGYFVNFTPSLGSPRYPTQTDQRPHQKINQNNKLLL